MKEGRDKLNFSTVESLHSKLLDIIIIINMYFIDGSNWYHFPWNALFVNSVL